MNYTVAMLIKRLQDMPDQQATVVVRTEENDFQLDDSVIQPAISEGYDVVLINPYPDDDEETDLDLMALIQQSRDDHSADHNIPSEN